uniref:Uncharacterized protein n=1 Tax=Arundo donax TaxID=35708 RepID=A0A0A9FLN5_ARUDO
MIMWIAPLNDLIRNKKPGKIRWFTNGTSHRQLQNQCGWLQISTYLRFCLIISIDLL